MRYFLLAFVFVCAAVVSIAGFRGSASRRPPIEIFPDMDRQPKLRPQTAAGFFNNGMSSRLPVAGTIARSQPYQMGDQVVYPFEDTPVNSGRITGTTNFVETNPLPITAELLKRGRERFQIYCQPCHGAGGDGKGITSKYGMVNIANFHDQRLVVMPDGEIFNTITHGKNLMGAYGPNVAVLDRWAIIGYVRVLQRSRLATTNDVPEQLRSALPK
jgi:mono/diheme cytochrome c family protein